MEIWHAWEADEGAYAVQCYQELAFDVGRAAVWDMLPVKARDWLRIYLEEARDDIRSSNSEIPG